MTITYRLDDLDGPAPLWHRHAGQDRANPALVFLDESGSVWADSRSPGTWTHGEHIGRVRSWRVSPASHGPSLAAALRSEPIAGLLERVHAGLSIEWDGSNHRGRLNEDAQDASEILERQLQSLDIDANIWPADEFLSAGGRNRLPDMWPADLALDDAVQQLDDSARQDGLILDGSVRDCLLRWAEGLYHNDTPGLSTTHLDALVAAGMVAADRIHLYSPGEE